MYLSVAISLTISKRYNRHCGGHLVHVEMMLQLCTTSGLLIEEVCSFQESFVYLVGTIDSVLIKRSVLIPGVVSYTSLFSWDHRQCPD